MDSTSNDAIDRIGASMTTDPGAIYDVYQSGSTREQAEIVATQMESAFYQVMLKAMRETVPEDSLMGGDSPAVRNFQSMFDEQMAHSGGFAMDPAFHERLVEEIMAGTPSAGDGVALPEDTETAG